MARASYSSYIRSRFAIAPDGYLHIGVAVALVVVLFALRVPILPWFALAIAALVVNFFRDPDRTFDRGPEFVVAPADGKVIDVADVVDHRFLGGPARLICIFMSPLDVHVNRIPADATVVEVRYREGGFRRAWAGEASTSNEQNAILCERADGVRFCFVQISGFLARRIVCRLAPGERVRRGQRFGMIKFGSRVDVYLPGDAEVLVQVGDRTRAGASAIARWR